MIFHCVDFANKKEATRLNIIQGKNYILVIALVLLLVIALTSTAAAFSDDPVVIPDENLEAAIRNRLNIPEGDITKTDMEKLVDLNASNLGIIDLTGLEYAVNLEDLNLNNNQISDISALAGLTSLEELWLYNNEIIDISALENLENLVELFLHYNNISNIKPLDKLVNLERLELSNNNISELCALADLTGLINLNLGRNQISDITILADFTALTRLAIYGNQVSDISALAGLTNLEQLELSNNDIECISALSNLAALTLLELQSNEIIEITVVSGLENLERLRISNNQIYDITVLSGLTSLETLWLSSNDISDITALSNLVNLKELLISFNEIDDITVLSGLTSLTNLSLRGNQFASISPLSELTSLRRLYLSGNSISDITALSGLVSLDRLWLDNNHISDISALKDLTGLEYLYLENNQIRNISAISGLTGLQALRIFHNYIDITPDSDSMLIINALITAGVSVSYEPQYEPSVSITAKPESPTYPGDVITFTAHVEGLADPEYAFDYRVKGTDSWTLALSYSYVNSFSAAVNTEGEYQVRARVRSTGSTDDYEFEDIIDHVVVKPDTVEAVTLIADPAEWQVAGEEITFTAEVTAGNANAEFAFYYKLPGGSWILARPYAADPEWEVSTSYVGEVQIGVLARAIGSDAFDEARDIIDYSIYAAAPVEEVELTADPERSQQAGESITFTAEVTAGNTDAEFAFYYKAEGGDWILARPYAVNLDWEVSTNFVGDVQIGVLARAVGSDAFDEARDILDYEITAP